MTTTQHTTNRLADDDDLQIDIDLDGPSGNAFWIIGSVVRFLRATDQAEVVPAFMAKATHAASYADLLKLARSYAPVSFHRSGRPINLYAIN